MRMMKTALFALALMIVASFASAQTATSKSKPVVRKPVAAAPAPKPVEQPKVKAFSNDDVVKLQSAGFSDEDIVAAIEAAKEKNFDTSADALIALKTAGVSPRVMAAVLGRSYTPPAPPPAPEPVVAQPVQAAPAPVAAKPENKVGRFFGGMGRAIGIKKGPSPTDSQQTSGSNVGTNGTAAPTLGWEQSTRNATIVVRERKEVLSARIRQHFTAIGTNYAVNESSGAITTAWKPERCQGLGHCSYQTTIQFAEDGTGQTTLRVQTSRVYGNELTNAKSYSFDHGRSKKVAAELASVLSGQTMVATK